VATDDAAADLARLRAAGSGLGEPEARSRTRPDGEIVRWRAAFPASLDPDGPPFVVEHEPVGAEWGDAARAARARFVHPAGGVAVATGITLPVPDASRTAHAYEATVGLRFEGDPPRAGIGDQAITLVRGVPLADPAIVDLRLRPERRFDVEVLGVRWRSTLSAPRHRPAQVPEAAGMGPAVPAWRRSRSCRRVRQRLKDRRAWSRQWPATTAR